MPAATATGCVVDAAVAGDVPDRGAIVVEVAGRRMALVRDGDAVRAFDATCTHAAGPVEAAGCLLVCAWHGAAFDRTSGHLRRGPARKPLRRYPAEVIDGIVRVALPS